MLSAKQWTDGWLALALSFCFLFLCCGTQAIAAPANDNFSDRVRLTGASTNVTGSYTGASFEPGEPSPDNRVADRSVWWEWIAEADGGVGILTSGVPTSFLAVFQGTELADLRLIEKSFGAANARVSFRAIAGQRYIIRAAGIQGETAGIFTLQIRPGPANDNFAGRIMVGLPSSTTVNMHGASREPSELPAFSSMFGPTVWYSWQALGGGGVSIRVVANADTPIVSVYRGDALTNLSVVAKDLAGDGTPCEVNFRASPGTTYHIAVETLGSPQSPVTLQLEGGARNDDFEYRVVLDPNKVWTVTGSTIGASRQPGELVPGTAGTLWYEWPITEDKGWLLEFENASAVVMKGSSLGNLALVARSDAMPPNFVEALRLRVTQSQVLFIAVTPSPVQPPGPFKIQFRPAPANDDFANRATLSELIGQIATGGITREPNEPMHNPFTSAFGTAWWEWTAPASGAFTLVSSHQPAPFFAIYQGSSLTNLTPVQGAPRSENETFKRPFRAKAGEKYLIALDDPFLSSRVILFQLFPPPPNDDFANAELISSSARSANGSLAMATVETSEPMVTAQEATVWFRWSPPRASPYAVRTPAAVRARIYQGSSLAGLINAGSTSSVTINDSSVVSFMGVPGQTYYFQVTAPHEQIDLFQLEILETTANDLFEQRQPIIGSAANFRFGPVTASPDPGQPGSAPEDPESFANAPSLWWKWRCPESGGYQIRISPSAFALLAVFTGSAITNLQQVVTATLGQTVSFYAAAGEEYTIFYAFKTLSGGELTFDLQPTAPNDAFAAATPLVGASVQFEFLAESASVEPGEPPSGAENRGTLWSRWIAPSTGSFRIRTVFPATPGHGLTVFSGNSVGSLTPLASHISGGTTAQVAVRAVEGELYSIAHSIFAQVQPVLLGLTIEPGPSNDDFANRLPLEGPYVVLTNSCAGATREPDEPRHTARTNASSVWFEWTAPQDGSYLVSIPNSGNFSIVLSNYVGNTLQDLRLATMTTVSLGADRRTFAFTTTAGAKHQFAVEQSMELAGPFSLWLSPSLTHDTMETSALIAGTNIFADVSTVNARTDSRLQNVRVQWKRWVAPAQGLAHLTVWGPENLLRAFEVRYDDPFLRNRLRLEFTNVFNVIITNTFIPTNVMQVRSTFVAEAGTIYYVKVGAAGASTNLGFHLQLEETGPVQGFLPFQWSTGGSAAWRQDFRDFASGPNSLTSGLINTGQLSWVQAVIPGPGTLRFSWKRVGNGSLMLDILTDRSRPRLLAPANTWTQAMVTLTMSTNILRWTTIAATSVIRPPPGFVATVTSWIDSLEVTPRAPQPFRFRTFSLNPLNGGGQMLLQLETERLYRLQTSTNLLDWQDHSTHFFTNEPSRYIYPRFDLELPGLFFRLVTP